MLKKFGKFLPRGALLSFASLIIAGAVALAAAANAYADGSPVIHSEEKEAVVLYTNDVHCSIEGYAAVAALRASLEEEGHAVLAVDAGDNFQGETIGSLTRGEAAVELMNAVPYALSVPGNHEFDFGLPRFFQLLKKAHYAELSCNIREIRTWKLLLPAYKIFALGGRKAAFVGATTPETYTKVNPRHFADSEGRQVYGFSEKDLYARVQEAVDAARAEGAETVILVSHLGMGGITPKWTAREVIAQTRGIDAVLDGHSHEVFAGEIFKNADGKDVLYSQTGTKLQYIGKLSISPDGALRSELIPCTAVNVKKSSGVKKAYAAVRSKTLAYEKLLAALDEPVAFAEVSLVTDDPRTGERRVRKGETNLGDFCADAYRTVIGAQAAMVNGGGLRSAVKAGPVSLRSLMDVNPWNNPMCVVKMSGQAVCDFLEFNSRNLPDGECGGFCHVSGISYEIDPAVKSPVLTDDKGVFAGVREKAARRVSNVRIQGRPVDLAADYTIAGDKFFLMDGGDGTGGIQGIRPLIVTGLPDDVACLFKYVTEHLHGKITAESYGDPLGAGRIVIRE